MGFIKSDEEKELDLKLEDKCRILFPGTQEELENTFKREIRVIPMTGLKGEEPWSIDQGVYFDQRRGLFLYEGGPKEIPTKQKEYLLHKKIDGILVKHLGGGSGQRHYTHYGLPFSIMDEK